MRPTALLIAALLAFSLTATAQDKHDQKQDKPAPKKKERPPKIKHARKNAVIVLPVVNASEAHAEDASILSLYARAGLLKGFSERRFDIVSPAEVNSTLDATKLDVKNPASWTAENFDVIAPPWEAKYVVGVVINSISTQAATPQNGKGPLSADATVNLSSWLYDVAAHKFLLQEEKSSLSQKIKIPKDQKFSQKDLEDVAVSRATENAFKQFLSRFRKVSLEIKPKS